MVVDSDVDGVVDRGVAELLDVRRAEGNILEYSLY